MAGPRLMAAAAAAALVLLAGCEAKIGDRADAPAGNTAEAKAEDGAFSINAPGFQMKVDIPQAIANKARIDSDSDIVYPGSKVRGIHVDAGRDDEDSKVQLSFTSPDAPAKLADWYRSADRADKFTLAATREENGGFSFEGAEKEDGDPFTISLRPGAGGGTEGELRLRDRN